jgi:MFS family permease
MLTLGWMVGCWLISALNADQSTWAGYSAAIAWLLASVFTFFLPPLRTPKSVERLTLRQRLGWDALTLLKNPDHRVIFFTVALIAIPIAAFYPYTPPHLRELGMKHTSALMTLGQVTELICMFSMGALLLKHRLKWIVVWGLGFSVLRFILSAVNTKASLLLGVFLHGASFTLVVITAQIYLDQRVDAALRARGQALMSLMTSGVGNLVGYLSTGWWFANCTQLTKTNWPLFWNGLALAAGAVLIYFLAAYRGLHAKRQ